MVNSTYCLHTASLFNFRCYGEEHQQVRLGKECTVIIGYNGAGKTAFLTGIKKGLSFILSKDRRRSVSFIGDGHDIRESAFKVKDVRYEYNSGVVDHDYHYPCRVTLSASVMGEELEWKYEKPYKGRSLDKALFRPQLDQVLARYASGEAPAPLPVLAYFSDSYPHVRASLTRYEKDLLVDKADAVERRAGYYHWDETSTDFYLWRDLFCHALRKLEHPTSGIEATRQRLASASQLNLTAETVATLQTHLHVLERVGREVSLVKQTLRKFTQTFATKDNRDFALYDLTIGSYLEGNKEVFTLLLRFEDGHTTLFDMLPEGYKRLLAIAFEIVYRFVVLNRPCFDAHPTLQPEGIVIIDELELHLHPTLAQEALIRLRNAFPSIQFIVSTHSPAVVGNVKADGDLCRVLQLDSSHRFNEVKDSFGMDYSDTLLTRMGSYGRMHKLALLEELYREYSADGDNEGVDETLAELRTFFGDSPQAEQWTADMVASWNEQMEDV